MDTTPTLPVVRSVGEAADELGVRTHQITYLYRAGIVPEPAFRLGGRRVLTDADIAAAKSALASRKEGTR